MFISMVDTLVFSNDIENYDVTMSQVIYKLDLQKNQAKSYLTANISKLVQITIGTMTFEVLPNGKRGYAYILHNDLYELDIAQFRSKNEDINPIMCRIKSEALWSMGYIQAFQNIWDWQFKYLGNPINNKISRIDLCCHTDTLKLKQEDVDNFKGLYYKDTIYRHRRQLNAITFREEVNAQCFGSSSTNKIFCRIYDKVLEIEQTKGKTWFFNIWKEKGLDCNKVWNIEFQILREFMKERNINDVWDAHMYLGSLWRYCTEKYVVKINRDNENISRCSIHPFWQALQKAFDKIDSIPMVKREVQLKSDAQAMVPGAFGYLSTYAAKSNISDIQLALNSLARSGEIYLAQKNENFEKVVKKKKKLVDVSIDNHKIWDERALSVGGRYDD